MMCRFRAFVTSAFMLMFLVLFIKSASGTQDSEAATSKTYPIDLPAVLRLAGAQNLDVLIARQKLAEARANQTSAVLQFFPWVSPGGSYRRHDNLIQGTDGQIINVHKEALAPGGTLQSQVDLGHASFGVLAARQLVRSANYALESERQEAVLAAAGEYFDLVLAQAAVHVAEDAVKISASYQEQLQHAVDIGIALKGDLLRVQVQRDRNRLALRQAKEQKRIASARLTERLNLDPTVQLVGGDSVPLPIALMPVDEPLDSLISATMVSAPELMQSRANAAAASRVKAGALWGPLLPSVSAQTFFGDLRGGIIGDSWTRGNQKDYFLGLTWKVGPGGLFDFGRISQTSARLEAAQLNVKKSSNALTRQVVESVARLRSLNDQIDIARQSMADAEAALRLSRERREFGVGIVLENIQAEQDFTRTRLDYLKIVTEFNKAQYTLSKLMGKL